MAAQGRNGIHALGVAAMVAAMVGAVAVGYVLGDLDEKIRADETPAIVKPQPRPVPLVYPSVSYRVTVAVPVVVEKPPVAEPDIDRQETLADADTGTVSEGDEQTREAEAHTVDFLADDQDLDFVAMLHDSDGADVEDGFAALTPGTLTRMTWKAGESLYGSSIPTPVLVASGIAEGPTLCLTAAVHGDELNGIEIVRRIMYSLNPEKLTGRVVGVPIVNLQGFERHSRYLPDRRDLNRFFPGNPRGSSASRIAHGFFEQIVRRCDALVDLHTGSFHRTNLPQLRANLADESVVELSQHFGGLVILHSAGGQGTLRAAAVAAGVPAVTLEAGEPLRVDDRAVDHSVRALFTLMDNLNVYPKRSLWGNPEPTFYGSLWVRADKGGMLLGNVKLGKRVKAGDVLGTVTDPITNARQEITAPAAGRVIGMAINQFVMPGYAAFHLGVEQDSPEELPGAYPGSDVGHEVVMVEGLGEERDDSDE